MKKVKSNDIFGRINYLYQAANLLMVNQTNHHLISFYGACISKIATKNVLKIDASMKRDFCKKCKILLVPSVTLRVRLRGKREKHVVHTCLNCGHVKRYLSRPQYKYQPIAEKVGADTQNIS